MYLGSSWLLPNLSHCLERNHGARRRGDSHQTTRNTLLFHCLGPNQSPGRAGAGSQVFITRTNCPRLCRGGRRCGRSRGCPPCWHALECRGWALETVCSSALSREPRYSPARWRGLSCTQLGASCPGLWLGPGARSGKRGLAWAVGTPSWVQYPKSLCPTRQARTASQICTCTPSKHALLIPPFLSPTPLPPSLPVTVVTWMLN